MFGSPEDLATDLLPYVLRMLSPDVKPVIVNTGSAADKSRNVATASVRKASEKALVKRAVDAMAATGVRFERSRVEFDDGGARANYGGWVFRMEPPLDVLGQFETMGGKKDEKVRFAVRQVLEMEWKRENLKLEGEARRKRGGADEFEELPDKVSKETPAEEAKRKERMKEKLVKRDFFGRVMVAKPVLANGVVEVMKKTRAEKAADEEGRVWISFHEGFSNAVRKPVTIEELMRGL
jgi:chromosome transmission fidelity protein 18